MVLVASCNSFKKMQKKYGRESHEILTIDFEKQIWADSLELEINLHELEPLVPVVMENNRNKITVVADGNGNIRAKAVSKAVLVQDTVQKKVNKISFYEADFKGYVSRKEAKELIIEAKRQGIEEGKTKKGIFGRIEDGLLQLFWIFLLIVVLIFIIRKVAEKSINDE